MDPQPGLEERLERIEIKLAYIEDFLARFQDEFVARSKDFDRLRAEQEAVKGRLRQISRTFEEISNQRPPHY
ncbi:MAG: SlyX family protein [Treponema sp.]|nr:SlyX family protein [Treponema sp.]